MGRLTASLTAVAALALWTAPAPVAAAPGHDSHAANDAMVVRRVHAPILLAPRHGADEDACRAPAPASIRVSEDGMALRVTAVGRRPLRRLHVLLVDTSGSMRDDLDAAREAARRYVDDLPTDDLAMIAAFDVRLRLVAAPTLDRRRVRRGIESLVAGHHTAVWDALHDLIRSLGDRPEETVIVLISDGEDNEFDGGTYERVAELASTTPDLVIFPVGIGLPGVSTPAGLRVRSRFGELARSTGGECFRVDHGGGLDRIEQRIRERLDRRLYVSYVPAPQTAAGWRRRRIELDPHLPCTLTMLAATRRFDRGDDPPRAIQLVPAGGAPSATPDCVPDPGAADTAVIGEQPARVAAEPGRPAMIRTRREGTLLVGRTADIVHEPGALFVDPADARRGGRRHGRIGTDTEMDSRAFVVLAPPLAEVRERLTSPAKAVLEWLRHDDCPADDQTASPWLIHGRTFLGMRELLGAALVESRADWRAFVAEAAGADVDRELARLDTAGSAPGKMAGLRRALIERAVSPRRGRAGEFVAAWLGDVDADVVAHAVERLAVDDLLSGDPAVADLLAQRWNRLCRTFAPATRRSLIVPLVPAWDADSGRVGFYRVLLARPLSGDKTIRTIAPRPLATDLARHVLALGSAAGLGRGWSVAAIEIGEPRRPRSTLCGVRGSTMRRVALYLEGQAGRARIRGWVDEATLDPARAAAPSCVIVEGPDGRRSLWHSVDGGGLEPALEP